MCHKVNVSHAQLQTHAVILPFHLSNDAICPTYAVTSDMHGAERTKSKSGGREV